MATDRTYEFGERRAHARGRGERLARGLAWFSVGLGLAELTAPGGVARTIGVSRDRRVLGAMRVLGARELAAGIGLFARPRSAAFAWMRLTGDLIDLALLGTAFGLRRRGRERVLGAIGAVAGVSVLDLLAGKRLSGARGGALEAGRAQHFRESITIGRPVEEVYRFWRDFQNLPRFMAHLDTVEILDERRSHWVARGPADRSIEWQAELVEDVPNERIAWRSIAGAGTELEHAGSVRFVAAPGGRGTEVHVEMRYDAPFGRVGVALAKLFGRAPAQEVKGDLKRLKQVLETGEVIRSDASIHSGMHPARPPEQAPAPSDRVRPNGHEGSTTREENR